MAGVGETLHRQKVTSPRWAIALVVGIPFSALGMVGIGLALTGLLGLGAGLVVGSLVLAGLSTVAMVVFASARIAVSEGEIHIQIGMAGPRIPIASVVRVELAPSGTNKVGMGVGNDLRGTTTYRMWGNNDEAVHIHLEGGKRLIVVCKEPVALHRAIQEALARRARVKVRVEPSELEASEVEEATAREAERSRARSE